MGIQTGTLVWGALTSLGVTALVTASHVVYEILRCAGAAYLLWMATRMIDDTFRVRPTDAATTAAVTGVDTLAAGWRQGTLTNLINPKTGVFYIAVLPQFIPAGAPHFSTGQLLTAVHIAVGVLWCGVLIVSVSAPGTWLRRARVRRVLDRVTDTLRVPCGTVSSGPAPSAADQHRHLPAEMHHQPTIWHHGHRVDRLRERCLRPDLLVGGQVPHLHLPGPVAAGTAGAAGDGMGSAVDHHGCHGPHLAVAADPGLADEPAVGRVPHAHGPVLAPGDDDRTAVDHGGRHCPDPGRMAGQGSAHRPTGGQVPHPRPPSSPPAMTWDRP